MSELLRLADPVVITGLATVCVGGLIAALLIASAPFHDTEPEGHRHMRVYNPNRDAVIDDRGVDAAVEALAFAVRWAPFGGADRDEIFVTFGLTPEQFGQRLRRAADHPEARHRLDLSPTDHAALLAEAQRMSTSASPDDTTRQAS
ncbi:hypothetical protein [Williamsia maris]|uniref:Uncharacterized protein n=1 Tax=Williamsia maris TaxID=72806 RepID=A0ABT1HC82_9NOCA|nr:hypothetical protein [Williamsia maris]MCP2175804.1 hypothetical protein [Williamsia maris]